MTKKLRVGIIGAHWGTATHLPAWRSIDGVDVTAICTSRQETADRAAAEHHIAKAYGSYEAMAKDPDIDIIDVGTRPNIRYDMLVKSIEGGKHIYSGIPFTDSLDHARHVCSLQKEHGVCGVVDAYTEWMPAVQYMKSLLEQGYIGDLWGFSGFFHMQMFNEGVVNIPEYAWFWEKRTGTSVLRNLGSHMMNLLTFLFGEMAEVLADLRCALPQWHMPDGTVHQVETHDHASLLLRLKNGVAGPVDLSWSSSNGKGFRLAVHGSKGRLELCAPSFPTPESLKLYGTQDTGFPGSNDGLLDIPENFDAEFGIAIKISKSEMGPIFPMALAMQSLVKQIKGDSTPAAPGFPQACHVQEVIQAAEVSAETKRWCQVG